MYNSYFGSDPTFILSNLEFQKSQIEHQMSRTRAEYARQEQNYKIIVSQIDGLKSQMTPAQPAADPKAAMLGGLGEMFGVPNLTPEQFQAVLSSPDGQALSKLVNEEMSRILKGGKPPEQAATN